MLTETMPLILAQEIIFWSLLLSDTLRKKSLCGGGGGGGGGSPATLDVVLQTDVKTLSEIIVTGYSTQRQSDVTGAVAAVGLDKIKDIPKANVLQQLQGRVPGLYVESSGQPSGQTGQILIRGLNTLGDNSPLYIIDGVP